MLGAGLALAAAAHAQVLFRGAATAAAASGASGTVAFGSVGTVTTDSGNCPQSMAPGIPAGTAAGDLLVLAVTSKDDNPVSVSGGWTALHTDVQGTAFQVAIYWKVAVTGETAPTVGKTGASCDVMIGRISRFTGVDTTSPFDGGVGAVFQNTAAVVNTGQITTSVATSMLVITAHTADASNTGVPGGFTEPWESTTAAGSNASLGLKYQVQATAGTKGAFSMTQTSGGTDIEPSEGVLFALRPARAQLTINVPAGTLANDVMVATIALRPSTVVVTPPAGWTGLSAVSQPAATSNQQQIFYRIASGAEPASYTWLFESAHAGAAGAIVSYSGVDTTTPIDASGGNTTPQGTDTTLQHRALAVSTATVDTMVLSIHSFASAATWTPPALTTERVDIASQAVPSTNGVSLEIDEVGQATIGTTGDKVATASNNGDTGVAQIVVLRPRSLVDHYLVGHGGSGVGCVDQTVTITAHDATHNPVDAGGATLAITTSNSKGSWVGVVSGGGTLLDGTPGDGTATYTFAAGSGSAQLAFRYANLTATSDTFSFNVTDGTHSEASGSASAALDDPSFTMYQAGFQFRNVTDGGTTIPVQIAGKPSSTGFNAKVIRLQAIKTDDATGSCIGVFTSQTRTVELGAECNNPAACAGRVVGINGTAIPTSSDNGGVGAASYGNVALTFNASSEADTVISYSDAGQISLHARYDLDTAIGGYEMLGSSNAFVVRPFGIAFSGVPHRSTPGGSAFAAAGDNFSMALTAYQWAAGEDADADGVPDLSPPADITDNGNTPNYAASASVTATANLAGGAGAISRGATCTNAASVSLAGGTGTAADWCYSEVGNVLLSASAPNYLGSGQDVTGSSGFDGDSGGGYLGRFGAKQFALIGAPTLVNRAAIPSCSSTFTYMNEGLTLTFALEARNAQGAKTSNYSGGYAKHDPASGGSNNPVLAYGIGARSGTTDLSGRLSAFYPDTVPAWSNGQLAVTGTNAITVSVGRKVPDDPDGPYPGVQLAIAPTDGDGAAISPLDLDVDNAGGNDHKNLGVSTEVRFGRLRLENAFGNEVHRLAVPMRAEYWNGTTFTTNTLDSCTAIPRSTIALTFDSSTVSSLAACETAVDADPVAFTAGVAPLGLSAPGVGNRGGVVLTVNIGTAGGNYCNPGAYVAAGSTPLLYLLGRWNDSANPDADANTAYDDKPSARAGFGVYGSQPGNFIYFRERY